MSDYPIIRPGDMLLIATTRGAATLEEAAELREQLMAQLPGLAAVMVLDGVEVQGVYRVEVEE